MPGYDRPRLQVLIGGRDATERCDSLVFSATDAGGFEIATLGLPSADRPKKGTPITIRQGLDVAWAGRVTEISDHSQHGRATKTTGCEGYRALLRDSPYSMVYVDQDLTRWQSPSTAREIALIGLGGPDTMSFGAAPDAAGNPSLTTGIAGPWTNPIPFAEEWYDAGAGNLIASFYYSYSLATSGVAHGNIANAICAENDTDTGAAVTVIGIAPGAAGYLDASGSPLRYVYLQTGPFGAGAAGDTAQFYFKKPVAYGNHGLALRGPDPGGFYPSDIARHALAQCAGILPGVIIDATAYIAPHVVYRTPTPADTIIDDMAKLMGWTWGVWEPPTLLNTQPRLDFRPPPPDATAVVSKAECDQLDVTARLGDLYNVAQVTYTDAAGSVGIATVTLYNAQLAETGIATRTLLLNMGQGSAAAAQTFGTFALALSQIAARAAGQATLPASVRLPYGGSKPAHLLRPGIDRLRIIDLVDGGPLLDIGTVRRDVFRISRTETTVGRDGTPSTRVELDSGSNLLETLQARLSLAAGVVGAGASGG
jgi:hypothetical protein